MCLKLFEMCKMSHFKKPPKRIRSQSLQKKKTILPPVCLLRTLEHELVNEVEFYGLRDNEREPYFFHMPCKKDMCEH